jgi:large subunit ribosomal protein L24
MQAALQRLARMPAGAHACWRSWLCRPLLAEPEPTQAATGAQLPALRWFASRPPLHPPRRNVGVPSAEMRGRFESMLDSIRTPRSPKRESPIPPRKWRVLRGDYVQVIGGPPGDIGKKGRVLEVIRRSNRVVVEGVNYVKKFVPAPSATVGGGQRKRVILTEGPLHVSNVAIVCPETGLPTRVGIRWLEDGTRVRISKRSGAIIPRPEILRQRRTPRPFDGRVLESHVTRVQDAQRRTLPAEPGTL